MSWNSCQLAWSCVSFKRPSRVGRVGYGSSFASAIVVIMPVFKQPRRAILSDFFIFLKDSDFWIVEGMSARTSDAETRPMKTRFVLLTASFALFLRLSSGVAGPTISYMRLAASPDCPHIYASTLNYSGSPNSVSISPGALVFLTVRVTGTQPFSAEWFLNGQDMGPGEGFQFVSPCTGFEGGFTYGYPGIEMPAGDWTVVITDGTSASTTSSVMTV